VTGKVDRGGWTVADIPALGVVVSFPPRYSRHQLDDSAVLWSRRDNAVSFSVSKVLQPEFMRENPNTPHVLTCQSADFSPSATVQVAEDEGSSLAGRRLRAVGWWPALDSGFIKVEGSAHTIGAFKELMAILGTVEIAGRPD
jgi:hypothetical protein